MGRTRLNPRRRNYKKIRDLSMGKRHEEKSKPEVIVESARSKCGICWEGFSTNDPPCALKSCGHVFGERCIYKWMVSRQIPTCPLCKKVLGPHDVLPLYIDFQDDAHEKELATLSDKIAELELREDRLIKACSTLRREWLKRRDGEEERKGT